MPVDVLKNKVILKHEKGSVAEILFYGATVISWRTASPESTERLFLSSAAALDGTKPVRGGIPLIFPCFGAPSHPEHGRLGQHGFARSELWSWGGVVVDDNTGVSVKFSLGSNPKVAAVYDKPFNLEYVVTLAEHHLSTDLHVKNTSTAPGALQFQALFHNYIRAPSNQVSITPLQNKRYYDKTETSEEVRNVPKLETRPEVTVTKFTDSVYEDAPEEYKISWPEGGISVKSRNLPNVVIWNPQENGRKIGDMEDEGWEKFVCLEPGFVRGFVSLESGQTWVGQQTLIADDGLPKL
ncbi:galactose mutarotase-like domain-containing protein [Infundibulicybe gibba]|nr:galactose mutarotase-like domain-containing protein [Infundibulicybe gibba]